MKILFLLAIISLSGCYPDEQGAYTGSPRNPPTVFETCFNGVVYYGRGQGIAPAFKPDGTLYTCGGQK